MITAPALRASFLNSGDERNYLSEIVLYHSAMKEGDTRVLEESRRRLEELLVEAGHDDGSIMLQEHWSILHESKGVFALAIPHREREIELIETLFALGGPVGPINEKFLIRTMRILIQDFIRIGDQQKADEWEQRLLEAK